jgi:hypothetical protein
VTEIQHVEIDHRGVVQDVGIVVAGEHEPRSAHVGGQLVDLVEVSVDHVAAHRRVREIANDEIVGLGFAVRIALAIHAANPELFALQTLHQMPPDEAAGTAHQRRLQTRHSPAP